MQYLEHDLYQLSTYAEPINLSFHQYLLMADEAILFHTGNAQQASNLIQELKLVLKDKPLKYIFVSHFEADECGGLSKILEVFTEAITICSEVTARQLHGFGFSNKVLIKKPGEKLVSDSYELEFISYPSEIHLWDGLVAIEKKRGIFFSSDLMMQFGESTGSVIDSDWASAVAGVDLGQIPSPDLLEKTKKALRNLNPVFVATGHGPCLRLR